MNYHRQREKHAQEIVKYLLKHYRKEQENLTKSYKNVFLDIIDKNLTMFESKKYDIKKYRKQFNEIKKGLEGKVK